MGQLHAGECALRLDEAGDPPQWLDMLVGPDTQVVRRNTPLRADRRRFDDHQPGATDGPTAQMHQMPVVGHPGLRRVLAHGRYGNPVGQFELAQGKRLKKLGHVGLYCR